MRTAQYTALLQVRPCFRFVLSLFYTNSRCMCLKLFIRFKANRQSSCILGIYLHILLLKPIIVTADTKVAHLKNNLIGTSKFHWLGTKFDHFWAFNRSLLYHISVRTIEIPRSGIFQIIWLKSNISRYIFQVGYQYLRVKRSIVSCG